MSTEVITINHPNHFRHLPLFHWWMIWGKLPFTWGSGCLRRWAWKSEWISWYDGLSRVLAWHLIVYGGWLLKVGTDVWLHRVVWWLILHGGMVHDCVWWMIADYDVKLSHCISVYGVQPVHLIQFTICCPFIKSINKCSSSSLFIHIYLCVIMSLVV